MATASEAELPPMESCARCGYDSRWTIREGLCVDCRLADERAGHGDC